MNRRDLITLLGGAAMLPVAARAQQGERMRRVGVLAGNGAESDPQTQARISAFREKLAKLGWVEERNLRIELRFGGGDANRIGTYAAELVRLAPDVIVTQAAVATLAVQQQTRTIPIIIAGAGDVGASGMVNNLAHPEGNLTGVANVFASIGGKWVELLKEAAPGVRRIALVRSEDTGAGGAANVPSIEEAARALAVPLVDIRYRSAVDIVRGIDAFAVEPDCGLIVAGPPPTPANREAILQLVAQYRLPAIHGFREFAAEGGLMAYGSDIVDVWRRSSDFVDRILRGAKVSDLPVEFPTKFELVINLKAAKAIGLTIPESLLLRADEVIE
jgi:putative ABC transport system substrate-binding protein